MKIVGLRKFGRPSSKKQWKQAWISWHTAPFRQ